MKYVIGIALALAVFASTAIAKTRYFLFPSEVSEFSSQNARAVNLFGITTDVQTTETAGVQFLISDNSVSIPVIYQGQLPQEFEDGNPAIVLGEFNGTVLFANVIIVQFSSKHLPKAALAELQSYGAQISD
jgi:cytochrome c-type biogenesis protein CcmE